MLTAAQIGVGELGLQKVYKWPQSKFQKWLWAKKKFYGEIKHRVQWIQQS